MRCQVQWKLVSEDWNSLNISLGFMYAHRELSQQTIRYQFPLKNAQFPVLWPHITAARVALVAVWVFFGWMCKQWSSAISRPEGGRFLEYKEMKYSTLLWTAFWTTRWTMARGTTFQHFIQRLAFRSYVLTEYIPSLHSTWIQLAFKGWFQVITSWLLFSWSWPWFLSVMVIWCSPQWLMSTGDMMISLQLNLTGQKKHQQSHNQAFCKQAKLKMDKNVGNGASLHRNTECADQ